MLSNEITWLIMIGLTFSLISVIYKYLNYHGLMMWIAISTIIANLQVLITVDMFGYVMTLGNIIYATNFLATDLLSVNHGKELARKSVMMGFLSQIIVALLMYISIHFTPIADNEHLYNSLKEIFTLSPRITLAGLTAYLISQNLDIFLFHKIAKRTSRLWIINNGSTLTSQLVDSVVFCLLAFYGAMPNAIVIEIIFTTYLFKIFVAFCDTPFLYLLRRKKTAQV